MSLNEELKALSQYRFEQALECLRSAQLLADNGDYRGSANFRKDYIKTGIFDVAYSDMIKSAFYVPTTATTMISM